jgi:PKHD-type hydroxylase
MYNLAPSIPQSEENESYVFWDGGFSDEDIENIIALGNSLSPAEARVGNDSLDINIRSSKVSWLPIDQSTMWVYDRMAFIARNLNSKYYRFDLTHIVDNIQYTMYNYKDQGKYDWHCDSGANCFAPRKLSLVLMLTDPEEYQGGCLELFAEKDPISLRPKKGTVIAFPSFRLHRVTQVTGGERKSLVTWVAGPPFR